MSRLHRQGQRFLKLAQSHGLNTGVSQNTPIVPIIIGSSVAAAQLSTALFARGINVQPMIYPAVAEDAARLRFFLSCQHTDEEIDYTIKVIAEELANIKSKKQAVVPDKTTVSQAHRKLQEEPHWVRNFAVEYVTNGR